MHYLSTAYKPRMHSLHPAVILVDHTAVMTSDGKERPVSSGCQDSGMGRYHDRSMDINSLPIPIEHFQHRNLEVIDHRRKGKDAFSATMIAGITRNGFLPGGPPTSPQRHLAVSAGGAPQGRIEFVEPWRIRTVKRAGHEVGPFHLSCPHIHCYYCCFALVFRCINAISM